MRLSGFLLLTSFAAAILSVSSAGFAAQAPTQLRGKTITGSFLITTPVTDESEQKADVSRRLDTFTIYISGQGRIFARQKFFSVPNSSLQETRDSKLGDWQFADTSTLAATHVLSGATPIRIGFDSSYSTCTISLIQGREGGKPRRWIGMLTKKTFTATGPGILSAKSCSIATGNKL
jgi:hypothetical protein